MAKRSRKGDHAHIRPDGSQVILLDAGERVLATRFAHRGSQVIQGELSIVERAPPRETAPR